MIPFTGSRFITSGVENEIPAELQTVMWNSIDDDIRLQKKVDYLQVFILKYTYVNGVQIQEIIHKQEQPSRKKRLTVETDNPVSAKVFVIDDVTHSTMLMNHEYYCKMKSY